MKTTQGILHKNTNNEAGLLRPNWPFKVAPFLFPDKIIRLPINRGSEKAIEWFMKEYSELFSEEYIQEIMKFLTVHTNSEIAIAITLPKMDDDFTF